MLSADAGSAMPSLSREYNHTRHLPSSPVVLTIHIISVIIFEVYLDIRPDAAYSMLSRASSSSQSYASFVAAPYHRLPKAEFQIIWLIAEIMRCALLPSDRHLPGCRSLRLGPLCSSMGFTVEAVFQSAIYRCLRKRRFRYKMRRFGNRTRIEALWHHSYVMIVALRVTCNSQTLADFGVASFR